MTHEKGHIQSLDPAPSHYLDQIKATIECDRRIHSLISLYQDLQKRVEAVELKVKNL